MSVCVVVKCSKVIGSRGIKLDDGLRKSTECLASISPDSSLAPGSLDRATSQPNLLALGLPDLVSSSSSTEHLDKSLSRSRMADDTVQTSKDVLTSTISSPPAGSGSHPGGKSPSRRHAAYIHNGGSSTDGLAAVGKEDHERSESEDAATDKLAVIDHTLAKVMSSLKTLDDMEQNASTRENVGGVKNSSSEDGENLATAVSETVPIIVKTSSTHEDRAGEVSSMASFSRGSRKKAATLPKSGSMEKIPTDADSQVKHSESSYVIATVEDRHQSTVKSSSLSRSDSAPHRKEGSASANVGHSRFEAPSRAIPAATPVVPGSVASGAASSTPSGAPAVPPKPSTARKPTTFFGSPKSSRPATDGKTGVVGVKFVKKQQ